MTAMAPEAAGRGMRGLQGKNVLITGGASGIGQAIAVRFAGYGANIALNYRRTLADAKETEEKVRACLASVRQTSVRDVLVGGDVSKEEDVVAMFDSAVAQLGGSGRLRLNGPRPQEMAHARGRPHDDDRRRDRGVGRRALAVHGSGRADPAPDHYLIQKMAEFNRERVPEGRVVPTQSSEASTAKEPIVSISPERQPLDHRAINHDLAVFTTHPIVGSGLPLWLPAGAVVRHELELFAAEIARHDGCMAVYSPVLAKLSLFETSGHWAKFSEHMFPPMRIGGDEFVLRPANCPHHAIIYAARQRSYRELPIRLNELAPLFRAERSGVLSGLSRVRQITLDDTHVFCRPGPDRGRGGTRASVCIEGPARARAAGRLHTALPPGRR